MEFVYVNDRGKEISNIRRHSSFSGLLERQEGGLFLISWPSSSQNLRWYPKFGQVVKDEFCP
jgi:hypothetical protein